MTNSEYALWAGVLVSLAGVVYSIVSIRTKAAYAKLRDIEKKLEAKADAVNVATLTGRIDLVEDRATRIETEMRHLPDKNTAHKLEVQLTELNGRVEALTERLQPVASMAARIQEVMIEKVSAI